MLVEVENLSKTFDDFHAVDNVSFGIERGEIIGMLGPNGAGKTTTIHMILGLITPTSGRISIFGKSMATHRGEILEKMNFTSPYVAFPFRLTVLENLNVFARIYNLKKPRRESTSCSSASESPSCATRQSRGCRRARIRGSGCARRS